MIKLECSLAQNITNCKLSTTTNYELWSSTGKKMYEVKMWKIYSEIRNYDNRAKLGITRPYPQAELVLKGLFLLC